MNLDAKDRREMQGDHALLRIDHRGPRSSVGFGHDERATVRKRDAHGPVRAAVVPSCSDEVERGENVLLSSVEPEFRNRSNVRWIVDDGHVRCHGCAEPVYVHEEFRRRDVVCDLTTDFDDARSVGG